MAHVRSAVIVLAAAAAGTLVLAAAGCFAPDFGEGLVSCAGDGSCPPRYHCADDHRCYHAGAPVPDSGAPGGGAGGGSDGGVAACGGPYQRTCPGDHCDGGRCAVNGTCIPSGDNGNMSGTVCAAGTLVACGAEGQPCCDDAQAGTCGASSACCGGSVCTRGGGCQIGGTCLQGGCVAPILGPSCGAPGQACCIGSSGSEAHFCTAERTACNPDHDTCATCGGPGQICCAGNQCLGGGCCDATGGGIGVCVGVGSPCGAGQGTCAAAGCLNGTCGGVGQPPCPGGVGCTAPDTVAFGNVCVACGGDGDLCCRGASASWCAYPYACNVTGRCAHCGRPNEPCCRGMACDGAGSCVAGKCR